LILKNIFGKNKLKKSRLTRFFDRINNMGDFLKKKISLFSVVITLVFVGFLAGASIIYWSLSFEKPEIFLKEIKSKIISEKEVWEIINNLPEVEAKIKQIESEGAKPFMMIEGCPNPEDDFYHIYVGESHPTHTVRRLSVEINAHSKEIYFFPTAGELALLGKQKESGVSLSNYKKGETAEIKFYYYNFAKDRKIAEYIPCSPDAVLPVEREIIVGEDLIKDTINLLIQGNLTNDEKSLGFLTEFPYPGFKLL